MKMAKLQEIHSNNFYNIKCVKSSSKVNKLDNIPFIIKMVEGLEVSFKKMQVRPKVGKFQLPPNEFQLYVDSLFKDGETSYKKTFEKIIIAFEYAIRNGQDPFRCLDRGVTIENERFLDYLTFIVNEQPTPIIRDCIQFALKSHHVRQRNSALIKLVKGKKNYPEFMHIYDGRGYVNDTLENFLSKKFCICNEDNLECPDECYEGKNLLSYMNEPGMMHCAMRNYCNIYSQKYEKLSKPDKKFAVMPMGLIRRVLESVIIYGGERSELLFRGSNLPMDELKYFLGFKVNDKIKGFIMESVKMYLNHQPLRYHLLCLKNLFEWNALINNGDKDANQSLDQLEKDGESINSADDETITTIGHKSQYQSSELLGSDHYESVETLPMKSKSSSKLSLASQSEWKIGVKTKIVNLFINVVNKIRVNNKTMDEIFDGLRDLFFALSDLSFIPQNCEATIITKQWIKSLSLMKPSEELTDEQAEKFIYDLESAFTSFYILLHRQ